MNAGIILGQKPLNILGNMQQGQNMAIQQRQFKDQNALSSAYQQHGAGAMNGDQNALNALAGFDPAMAGSFKQQGIASQRADANLNMRQQEFAMATQQYAQGLSAQERAAEAAKLEGTLNGAASFYAKGDEAGYNQWLIDNDTDPVEFPFGQFEAVAARAGTVIETLRGMQEANAPAAGPEWRAATPDEAAAYGAKGGQINTQTNQFKHTPVAKNTRITSDGKGGFTLEEGDLEPATKANPSAPEAMVAAIDGILNDPALGMSTGILSPLQNLPGTPMKRFQGRAQQLEGQAFLQAFESLKGAGQITEVEGAKATQAIGRIDSAQAPEDYKDALKELKEILVIGQGRPKGWAKLQQDKAKGGPARDFSVMPVEEMNQVDIESLSMDELEAFSRRYDELGS